MCCHDCGSADVAGFVCDGWTAESAYAFCPRCLRDAVQDFYAVAENRDGGYGVADFDAAYHSRVY